MHTPGNTREFVACQLPDFTMKVTRYNWKWGLIHLLKSQWYSNSPYKHFSFYGLPIMSSLAAIQWSKFQLHPQQQVLRHLRLYRFQALPPRQNLFPIPAGSFCNPAWSGG